jgi:hypothetical protein
MRGAVFYAPGDGRLDQRDDPSVNQCVTHQAE